eukprot:6196206-Pleurochrysis_carterae.AAC.2
MPPGRISAAWLRVDAAAIAVKAVGSKHGWPRKRRLWRFGSMQCRPRSEGTMRLNPVVSEVELLGAQCEESVYAKASARVSARARN